MCQEWYQKKNHPNLRASCVRCCLSVCRSSSLSSCLNVQMALGFQSLLTSGQTQSLEGVGEWGHSQLENSWMYFPHPPPGQVARGDCTCHNQSHIFCRDTHHVALPLLALEVLSLVSLNPVLCFEMSSFIKLTQLKVSASSLSLSSTMIVPEPSPG